MESYNVFIAVVLLNILLHFVVVLVLFLNNYCISSSPLRDRNQDEIRCTIGLSEGTLSW